MLNYYFETILNNSHEIYILDQHVKQFGMRNYFEKFRKLTPILVKKSKHRF